MPAEQAQQMRAMTADDIEASFRSSLKDVVEIAEKLSPHCKSVDELVDMLKRAIENDGQLRFLMGRVIPRPKR